MTSQRILARLGRRCIGAAQHLVDSARGKLVIYFNDVRTTGPISIVGVFKVVNLGEISFGSHTRFNSGHRGNPVGGALFTSIVVRRGARLCIGEGTGVSNSEIYCATSIQIGQRVLIGGGTRIYDTDFHALSPEDRQVHALAQGKSAPIRIGDDVFVGAFSTILKGVSIGDRAVIGAGSVVARDVPAGEIWAGNPAKMIRLSGPAETGS